MISSDRLLKDALKIASSRKVDVKSVAWDLLLHLILKRLEERGTLNSPRPTSSREARAWPSAT